MALQNSVSQRLRVSVGPHDDMLLLLLLLLLPSAAIRSKKGR